MMTAANLTTYRTVIRKFRHAFPSLVVCSSQHTSVHRTSFLYNNLSDRSNKKWTQQPVRSLHHFSRNRLWCLCKHGRHKDHCHAPHRHTPARGIKSNQASDSFVNPLLALQKYVSVPIFSREQMVFCPSKTEMDKAMLIFQGPEGSNVKHPATFVGSYADGGQVADLNLPEVCFLGRSNVGKSSLISVLLNAHPQVNVRVSKKPGHTKTVNLFRLGRRFTLVDMPGYGYNMPRNFQQSVEVYLSSSRRLCRTFLLVDGVAGLTSTDVVALDMLREFGVPFTVVMTKIDKAGRHKLLQNVLAMMKTCEESGGHGCFSQPFLVSSKTGDGLILLQTFIAYITGCIAVQGL